MARAAVEWVWDPTTARWQRRRPVRLATRGAFERLLEVVAPEGDQGVIYRTSPNRACQLREELIEFPPASLRSVHMMVRGGVIALSTGRGATTFITPPSQGVASPEAAEWKDAIDRLTHELRWWQRVGRGVPVVTALDSTQIWNGKVAIRAAWVGGMCGLLAGALSGWLASLPAS